MHSHLPFLLILHAHYLGNDTIDSEDDEDDQDNTENNLVSCAYHDDDKVFDLLLILAATLKLQKKRFIHSRNCIIFHKTLCANMRQLRDRRILRASLQDPSECSWQQLYISCNNQALVTLTGFDHQTSTWLLCIFESVYKTYSPSVNNEDGLIVRICNPNHGRPCLISAADCLGSNLAWTRLQGSTTSLQTVFGITGSRISKWLWFGRRILIAILCNHPDTGLKIPSVARIRQYKVEIEARHPSLMDVWCTIDRLKLYLKQSGDSAIQNMFYNGWTQNHYVSSVLVFCPDGTVTMTAMKYPGCFHDSQIADWGTIYKKLGAVFEENVGVCRLHSFCEKPTQFLRRTDTVFWWNLLRSHEPVFLIF